jgi:hypothetical protein
MEALPGGFVLRPPAAPGSEPVAELRYSEGSRPVLPAAAVAAEVLSHQPEFIPGEQSRPELYITAEGEYAALLRVRGTVGSRPTVHLIGAVYGDESMNVLDAQVGDPAALPAVAHTVRALLYAERLGLGLRKRRFLYDPPAGWLARRSGLISRYSPPAGPQRSATLVVHPAMPRDSSEETVLSTLLLTYQQRGFAVAALSAAEPVTSDFGLHGKAFCLAGSFPGRPELTCDLLVFADARYLYALIAESSSQADRAALQRLLPAVARSVRPIPAPAVLAPASQPSTLNYWSF